MLFILISYLKINKIQIVSKHGYCNNMRRHQIEKPIFLGDLETTFYYFQLRGTHCLAD